MSSEKVEGNSYKIEIFLKNMFTDNQKYQYKFEVSESNPLIIGTDLENCNIYLSSLDGSKKSSIQKYLESKI